jgi:hypothetical protein
MKCDSWASLLAHAFASLCFGHEPKARVVTSYMTRLSHLSFKKCTMKTKVSTPIIDIQRSKFIVQVVHELKVGNTNLALLFFPWPPLVKDLHFIDALMEIEARILSQN